MEKLNPERKLTVEEIRSLGDEQKKQIIARETGTSISTVRRALHPVCRHQVEPGKRARIAQKAAEYEFVLSHRPIKRHQAVGVMVPYSADVFQDPYHVRVLAGIAQYLHDIKNQSKYNIKLIFADESDYQDMHQFASEQQIDGLFILMWMIHPNIINWVLTVEKPFPVVLINEYDKRAKANFVIVDVAAGPEKAVRYLHEKGRRSIAFLKGPTSNKHESKEAGIISVDCIDSRQKYEGFQKGMKACGLETRPEWIKECRAYTEKQGYLMAKEIFSQNQIPDALVTSNDSTAIGALQALKDLKIACPEKVAVIGFDGNPKCELVTPKLTTIHQPLEEVGAEAARQMVELVEEGCLDVVNGKFKFDPQLVVRDST